MKKISNLFATVLVGSALLFPVGATAQSCTVADTSAGGIRYKMEQYGDVVPRFYINNQLIDRKQWPHYAAVIDRLMKALWLKKTQHPFIKNPDIQ